MRIILEDYGMVDVRMSDSRSASDAGAFYAVLGRYLNGGDSSHDTNYYANRIESFDGHGITGRIVGGEYDGTEIRDQLIETDLSTLTVYANSGEIDDSSPYERWT